MVCPRKSMGGKGKGGGETYSRCVHALAENPYTTRPRGNRALLPEERLPMVNRSFFFCQGLLGMDGGGVLTWKKNTIVLTRKQRRDGAIYRAFAYLVVFRKDDISG